MNNCLSTDELRETTPIGRRFHIFLLSSRSDEEIMVEIRKAQKELAHFEDRFTTEIEAGKLGKAKRLAHLMMRSYHCRLAALYNANRKIKRRSWRLRIRQLPDAATRLDLWKPSNEPILLLDKPKRNGGTRQVSEFGPLNRAAHSLLKTILEPVIKPQLLPSQHLLNGGRDKCATAAINNIENGGHKWACEMDIKNFYPSINIEWLKSELSMVVNPGSLERNIDASKLNYLKINASHNSNAGASRIRARERRMGLSQGSPLSSLLGEFVFERNGAWPSVEEVVVALNDEPEYYEDDPEAYIYDSDHPMLRRIVLLQ
jgi:hypothetical protein